MRASVAHDGARALTCVGGTHVYVRVCIRVVMHVHMSDGTWRICTYARDQLYVAPLYVCAENIAHANCARAGALLRAAIPRTGPSDWQ